MRPDRRLLLGGALAALLAPVSAGAAPSFAAVSAPIAALNAGLIGVMKAGKESPFDKRFAMLEPIVVKVFDLPHILAMSVGFGWPTLKPAEQKSLLSVFRQYTVASYVANFKSYDGEQFRVLPKLRSVGVQQVVATEIVPRNGKPTRIDYVMRQNGTIWQAVDVLLDGTISQVAVQRSDFHSFLASGGAAALIAALRKKVASLSGGALS
ncbi:MAG: ABC transporter substrate-binding protein [Rhodospirillales bacterium]|nr:ABC transporter substrate-binding protein [Rhodospirillales bacterium]